MAESQTNRREEQIFGVARVMSTEDDRRNYLDEVCAGDPETRREVEELLSIYDREQNFLESPPPELDRVAARGDGDPSGQPLENPNIGPGTMIGPYKILELIGQGGMGNVYMAEQIEPVHRKVALKVIKSGMDSRLVIARFEAERQALALMDHPSIAKFYDAGVASSGSPYFVMELIMGRPIVEYCQQRKLDLKAKLALFTQVCHGVQHAHQKGIIHRDIKPSNVLVARYDDRPVAKVIDFGVAKAIGEKLTDKTMFTRFGQLVGSLEYMSPEQAQLNQLDIDTRSDIYSLGAVLYELLTGEPPFEKEKLNSAAFEEVLRIIREDEPSTPSTRLSSLSGGTASQDNPIQRRDSLNQRSSIPSDLDWIVMKCLEKDRARRYTTTNDFARDIQRYLDNEPVSAGPPSFAYKLRKFFSRNKVAVSVSMIVVASLVIGLGISTWQAIRASHAEEAAKQSSAELRTALTELEQEKREADLQRDKAEMERSRASKNFEYALGSLKNFLVEFANVDLSGTPGAERQRQKMLRDAALHFSQLMETNPQRTDLQREFADALYQLGGVSTLLDDVELADQCYGECIAILSKLLEKSGTPLPRQDLNHELALAYRGRGQACQQRQPEMAEEYFRRAIDICRSLEPAAQVGGKLGMDWLAQSLNEYGINLARHGRLEEANEQYKQALDVCSETMRGGILHNMAQVQYLQKNLDEALQQVNAAIECPGQPKLWVRNHQQLKAKLHYEKQEIDLARIACNTAIRINRGLARMSERSASLFTGDRVFSDSLGDTTDAEWFVEWLQFRARILSETDRHEKALEALQEAHAIHLVSTRSLLDRAQMELRRDLENALADVQTTMGHNEAAEYTRTKAQELQSQLQSIPPNETGITFAVGARDTEDFGDVAVAEDGSVYVVGHTGKGINFQSDDEFRGIDEADYAPAVVCKYTPNGSVVWIRPLGTPLGGGARAIAVDHQGNIFVSGIVHFDARRKGIANFGDLEKRYPEGVDASRSFVAKINANGQVLWVQWTGWCTAGPLLFDYSIAVTPMDDVIVGGGFKSDSRIGDENSSLLLHNRSTSENTHRGYVAKFAGDGTVQWARVIDADAVSKIGGVTSDAQGNVYICGVAKPLHSTVFGNDIDGNGFRLDDPNKSPLVFGFLAKLDSKGHTLWVRPQVGTGPRASFDVAIGSEGRVYLSSYVHADTDLDGTQHYDNDIDLVKRFAPPNEWNSNWDSNLSCWDTNGRLQWNRVLAGDIAYVSAYSLAARKDGGVFVAGRIAGRHFVFDGKRLPRHPGTGRDGFALSVDSNGKLIKHWFYTTGADSRVIPWAVAANRSDQLAIVGWFLGEVRAPTGNVIQGGNKDNKDAFLTIFKPL